MNVEIIGAMMAGSRMFADTSRGSGSGQLTRAELAGALSGLPAVAVDYAFAKWGLDDKSMQSIRRHVIGYSGTMAIQEGCEVAILIKLGLIALDDLILPPVCGSCNGAGYVMAKVCKGCNGVGHKGGCKRTSQRDIAAKLGMARNTFVRKWSRHYDAIYLYLLNIDSEIQIVVNKF